MSFRAANRKPRRSEELSNQPAKLAERVLAPGDGEAKPEGSVTNFKEPAE